jgi:hypothetical protein
MRFSFSGEASPYSACADCAARFKIALVKIHHAAGWMEAGYGGCFKDFVIQSDGQFSLAQAGPDEQIKSPAIDSCRCDRFPPQSVHHRGTGKLNAGDDESAWQPKVLKHDRVNHVAMFAVLRLASPQMIRRIVHAGDHFFARLQVADADVILTVHLRGVRGFQFLRAFELLVRLGGGQ